MLRMLVSFIAMFGLSILTANPLVFPSAPSNAETKNYEEIRDNLVELRLALQKGDLIEALQHLNNAEEQLLLFAENATTNSTISQ
jgi:S-adenosylmethionine:diacylglycerol 3-amino-3-carboxypropyl transferase